MASRSPEDWISYLITVIESTPAKPDWNQVAETTGAYKSGKFASAAYLNLKKKYPAMVKDAGANVPATPKSTTKKRAAANADLDDDEDDEPDVKPKTKRGRKAKITTKKSTKVMKDESSEEGEVKEDADAGTDGIED